MRPSLPRTQYEPAWYVAQSPQRLKRFDLDLLGPRVPRPPPPFASQKRARPSTARTRDGEGEAAVGPPARRAFSSPRRESSVTTRHTA